MVHKLHYTKCSLNKNNYMMGDIDSIIKSYDYYFEGKCIKSLDGDNFLLLPEGIITYKESKFTFGNTSFTVDVDDVNDMVLLPKNKVLLITDNYYGVLDLETREIKNYRDIIDTKEQIDIVGDNVFIGTNDIKILNDTSLGYFDMRRTAIKVIGNKIAVAMQDIEIWDLEKQNPDFTLSQHDEVIKLEGLLKNRLLSISNYHVKIWDLTEKKIIYSFSFNGEIESHLFLTNKLIVAYKDFTVRIFDLDKQEIIGCQKFHIDSINFIRQLPNKQILLVSKHGMMCVWDLLSSKVRYNFDTYSNIKQVEVSSDGHVVICCDKGIEFLK